MFNETVELNCRCRVVNSKFNNKFLFLILKKEDIDKLPHSMARIYYPISEEVFEEVKSFIAENKSMINECIKNHSLIFTRDLIAKEIIEIFNFNTEEVFSAIEAIGL